MHQYEKMSRVSWQSRLAEYGRFLLRWGWYILLSIILTTVLTKRIPDTPSLSLVEASLQVEISLPSGSGVIADANADTFFASLITSPGTLNLAVDTLNKMSEQPQYSYLKGIQLSSLQSFVSSSPVYDANVIQLNAIWTTSDGAQTIATVVYQSFLKTVHLDRSPVVDGLRASLNAEYKQVESDLASVIAQIQSLKNQASTPQYRYLIDLQAEEKQLANTISGNLATLGQQGFVGYQDILQLVKPQPNFTTIPAASGNQAQRLLLAPIIGLLMGLAGALLASRFSNRLPLSGKKREMILPHIASVFPPLANLNRNRLAILQQAAAQCQPLLLHLRYQAQEHEKRLQLITVTSPVGGEGKSTIAASFAIACAQNGFRTLLVDANPHKPVLHTWFQLSNTSGTLNCVRSLAYGTLGPSPIVNSSITKLSLLPIGTTSNKKASQAEVPLSLDGLLSYIELLTKQADIVVFDGSSLLRDADSIALASLSDIVLLTIDANISKSSDVLEAESLLSDLGVPFATILNRTKRELVD